MPFLCTNFPKAQQLKNALVMYRPAFGQPRQEDLLALLKATHGEVVNTPQALDLDRGDQPE